MLKKDFLPLVTNWFAKIPASSKRWMQDFELVIYRGSFKILQAMVSICWAIFYAPRLYRHRIYVRIQKTSNAIYQNGKVIFLQRLNKLSLSTHQINRRLVGVLVGMLVVLSMDIKKLVTTVRTHLDQYLDQNPKRYPEVFLKHFRALAKPSAYGAILATAVICATSNADVADEMKVLIEQRKPAEAFALGNKHPELMGDPLFDYFYGVAATETGHVSMGVLSLERVLLNDPNNDLVRLELARAYYSQGEYQRAKDEFIAVQKNQPPAGVVSTINTYLDDIKAKEGQYKAVYGVFVELGMGYNLSLIHI